MKIEFLAIYIVVGAAFLIASLWVTLSGGKSAKAIRCKYKLGGIVLTAWAMLSVASCQGDLNPKMITCYDPAPPEMVYYLKDNEEVTDVKSGDVLVVKTPIHIDEVYTDFLEVLNNLDTFLNIDERFCHSVVSEHLIYRESHAYNIVRTAFLADLLDDIFDKTHSVLEAAAVLIVAEVGVW